MNKVVLAIIVIAAVVGGWYFFGSPKSTANEPAELTSLNTEMEEKTGDAMEEKMEEKEENTDPNATVFAIADGSTASYVAQKKFFGKPTAAITGSTSGVSGSVSVNAEAKTVTVDASITPNFTSGEGHRDATVAGFFQGPIVINASNATFDVDITNASEATISVPLDVTINDITKSLPFDVVITGGDNVSATGSASLNVKDFGIDPPSIVNVYTVDDIIEVQFTLSVK